jgi:hypothetical protein
LMAAMIVPIHLPNPPEMSTIEVTMTVWLSKY